MDVTSMSRRLLQAHPAAVENILRQMLGVAWEKGYAAGRAEHCDFPDCDVNDAPNPYVRKDED